MQVPVLVLFPEERIEEPIRPDSVGSILNAHGKDKLRDVECLCLLRVPKELAHDREVGKLRLVSGRQVGRLHLQHQRRSGLCGATGYRRDVLVLALVQHSVIRVRIDISNRLGREGGNQCRADTHQTRVHSHIVPGVAVCRTKDGKHQRIGTECIPTDGPVQTQRGSHRQ